MSDSKHRQTSPNSLTDAKGVTLTEGELDKVSGGDKTTTTTPGINQSKFKAADKSAAANDAFIRG